MLIDTRWHRPHQEHVEATAHFSYSFGFSANGKQRCTAEKKKKTNTTGLPYISKGRVHPNIV